MATFNFDAKYLERLRNGDDDTTNHFVRYCSELITKRLRSPNHSPSLIDDVKQETLLRLWSAIHEGKVRETQDFGAFVSGVCQNVLREAYRNRRSTQSSQDYSLSNPTLSPQNDISADFTIVFDPQLSPEQIKGTLSALADYYRMCGGVGLEVEFELEEALTAELTYV